MNLLRREKNRVNYMDHTVRGFDVSDDDLHGVVQEDLAILDCDGDILAKNCRGAGEGDHVRSHDLARDHMVEQDVGQLLFVFGQKQAVEGASGQGSEGIVSGGEDREGTFSAQGFDQFSSGHSSYEGGEASVSDSDVNDGVLFFHHGII